MVLNVEQTDVFALWSSLDTAPCTILAAVRECECFMRMGSGLSEGPRWSSPNDGWRALKYYLNVGLSVIMDIATS